jgi:hypothetical protein
MTNHDPAALLDELLQSTKRLYQAVAEDRHADTNRALHQRDGLLEQLAGVLPGASAAQIQHARRFARSTSQLEAQIEDLLQTRLTATGDRVSTVKRGVQMLRGYSPRRRPRTGGRVLNQQA